MTREYVFSETAEKVRIFKRSSCIVFSISSTAHLSHIEALDDNSLLNLLLLFSYTSVPILLILPTLGGGSGVFKSLFNYIATAFGFEERGFTQLRAIARLK